METEAAGIRARGWLWREWNDPAARLRLLCIAFILACLSLFAAKLFHDNWLPSATPQPAEPSAELKRARNLFLGGQIIEAKRLLEGYVDQDPKNSQAHLMLAGAYLEIGEPSLGLKHARTAVALDPTAIEPRMFLARRYQSIGWWQKSLDELDALLEYEPDNLPALRLRIGIAFNIGMPEVAINDADYAIRIYPNDPALNLLYGKLMYNSGRFEDGIKAANRAIAHGNDQIRKEAIELLAVLRQEQNR